MAAAERLSTITDEILTEVQQLPAELIHWVPAEGIWTVMDNLCHIREFVPFWTGEALRIVRRSGPVWGRDHTDTGRLAAVTNTAGHRLKDVVADIREAVRRSAETLRSLSDEDLAAEGMLIIGDKGKILCDFRGNAPRLFTAISERPRCAWRHLVGSPSSKPERRGLF
jgi:uncharacterized damage-inducible protein DinB